jgi:glycosyltransferase involved in cell wall biosynthesis
MAPDISIIIPTFRREKRLVEALSSVLGQTGVSVEVLVVDDSPEGSARDVVARVHDKRVNYQKNPNPTGGNPSVVRNLALPHARAPLIHFLDDDDIVPEGHYARVKAVFAREPGIGLVFGAIEPFGSGPAEQLRGEQDYFAASRRLALHCRALRTPLAFVGALLFVRALLVCSAGVVTRQAAMALGGFDTRLKVREDVDFFAFVARRFGARFLDDVALRYRISSDGSLMHSTGLTPEQTDARQRLLREARLTTNAKYVESLGYAEFMALKLFSRTVLRLL